MMFDAKTLTDEQVATIHKWASDGDQLAEIQKRMEETFDIRLTYMDTRFLILDLGIQLQSDSDANTENEDEGNDESNATPSMDELTEDDIEVLPPDASAAPLPGGRVRVSLDSIARPGMMVNGRVTFSDGESGAWYVDEMGRLGIEPNTPGYRPSEIDLQSFQRELQQLMEHQ